MPPAVKDPKMEKLAARVQRCIETDSTNPKVGENKAPKQIDPNWILVSWLNRLQTAPNVNRIHWGILYSFVKHSYDRVRPQVGVCVEITSEKGLRMLLEHNRR